MRPLLTSGRLSDRRRLLLHVGVFALLVIGFFVTHVFAQGAPAPALPTVSLLDRWLSPDAIIGAALVILYAGELRGDVRRLKADLRAIQDRLHDDYMTRETIEARLRGLRDDR